MAIIKIGEKKDEYYTQSFHANKVQASWPSTPEFISNPEKLWALYGRFDGPAGNGEEWGQFLDNYTWALWSYNDSSEDVEDWGEGSYTVAYVQGNQGGDKWVGFTAEVSLYVGAQ